MNVPEQEDEMGEDTTRRELEDCLEAVAALLEYPEVSLGADVLERLGSTVFSWTTVGSGPMSSGGTGVFELGGGYFVTQPEVSPDGPYSTVSGAVAGTVWLSDGLQHSIWFDGELSEFTAAFQFGSVTDWEAPIDVNGETMSMGELRKAVEAAEAEDRPSREAAGPTPTSAHEAVLNELRRRGDQQALDDCRGFESDLRWRLEGEGLLDDEEV